MSSGWSALLVQICAHLKGHETFPRKIHQWESWVRHCDHARAWLFGYNYNHSQNRRHAWCRFRAL